jgi:hypothetical protein
MTPRIRAEAPPPQGVAEDGDAVIAVDLVLDGESASDGRVHPKHIEEAGGHTLGP